MAGMDLKELFVNIPDARGPSCWWSWRFRGFLWRLDSGNVVQQVNVGQDPHDDLLGLDLVLGFVCNKKKISLTIFKTSTQIFSQWPNTLVLYFFRFIPLTDIYLLRHVPHNVEPPSNPKTKQKHHETVSNDAGWLLHDRSGGANFNCCRRRGLIFCLISWPDHG